MAPLQISNHLARLVLVTFILTFIVVRVLVILIMSRRIPDLYLHLGGTHVHHLNYGIFLLAGVGAYYVFLVPKREKHRNSCNNIWERYSINM